MFSLAPYLGLTLASFDMIEGISRDSTISWFVTMFGAGSVNAALGNALLYPLDTVRRRLQMRGNASIRYDGALDCVSQIWRTEGLRAFYRGVLINTGRMAP